VAYVAEGAELAAGRGRRTVQSNYEARDRCHNCREGATAYRIQLVNAQFTCYGHDRFSIKPHRIQLVKALEQN
jgi:hypothetical protein